MVLLANKAAIITGAGGAIGRATAVAFCKEGAKVGVLDINADTAAETVEIIKQMGGEAVAVVADISNSTQVKEAIGRFVQHYGSLDIFVNNAAFQRFAPFLELDENVWRRVIDVSLTGYFICGQQAARKMVELGTKGSIVNVASIAGQQGLAKGAAYAAAKGGIIALTKLMAVDLSPYEIRVNAVAPGPIERPGRHLSSEVDVRARLQRIPMGRFGLPHEVASAILFLCSDLSSYINGHILNVDGGWLGCGVLPDSRYA